MMGNDDLKAETSINKEIGLEETLRLAGGVTRSATTIATRLKRAMRRPPDLHQQSHHRHLPVGERAEGRWLKARRFLNVPASDTINLTNNITLHAAEQEQGDRRPSVDHPGVHTELYP